MKTFDKALHKKAVEVLKRYADDLSLLRYMEAEGYKYDEDKEGYIDFIKARKFLIFPKELKEEIKKTSKTGVYGFYQFVECDNGLIISWL